MDTSKKYVEMCSKAKEIQKLWGFSDGDYMVAPSGETWIVCDYYSAACYQGKEKKEDHQNASPSYFDEYSETFRNFHGGYEWEDSLIAKRKDCIWLPRQDRLQEMVDKRARKIVAAIKNTTLPYLLTQKFYYAVCGGSVGYPPGFTSMEQLWLAFVMAERWNKTWGGKKWIKRG